MRKLKKYEIKNRITLVGCTVFRAFSEHAERGFINQTEVDLNEAESLFKECLDWVRGHARRRQKQKP